MGGLRDSGRLLVLLSTVLLLGGCKRAAPERAAPPRAASTGPAIASTKAPAHTPTVAPKAGPTSAALLRQIALEESVSLDGWAVRSAIQRSASGDVLAMYVCDVLAGGGTYWVLDGARDRHYAVKAGSGVLTPDGKGFVYARQHLVRTVNCLSAMYSFPRSALRPPEVHTHEVARKIGVPADALAPVEHQDGFGCRVYVDQPIYVDLATGKERPLRAVGGAWLCHDDKRVLADHRRVGANVLNVLHWLDLEGQQWTEIAPEEQSAAESAFQECGYFGDGSLRALRDPTVLAKTRDGRLGFVLRGTDVLPVRFDGPQSGPSSRPIETWPSSIEPAAKRILEGRDPAQVTAAQARALVDKLGEPSRRPLALALNARGYHALSSDLDDALLLFEAAVAIDPTYSIPRLNAARVHAVRGERAPMLRRLAELHNLPGEAARLKRAASDPWFASFEDESGFKTLVGAGAH